MICPEPLHAEQSSGWTLADMPEPLQSVHCRRAEAVKSRSTPKAASRNDSLIAALTLAPRFAC